MGGVPVASNLRNQTGFEKPSLCQSFQALHDHPARSFLRSTEKSTFCNAHHERTPTQVMRWDGDGVALAPLLQSFAGLPEILTVSGVAKPLTMATGTPAC